MLQNLTGWHALIILGIVIDVSRGRADGSAVRCRARRDLVARPVDASPRSSARTACRSMRSDSPRPFDA
ncbi:hypothetical protein KEC56_04405 [Microbacterium sp. YMB-B2]|uniref:Uncharacterized protein n=1 Tax=Microbacterium tenebrionis TaxID=2830665 RepID=A0A9X1S0I5_9MICO|nr:hypothetical protein [Microbacterium tenebrionis]MCC2028768.1 hypothetical protein [Microbacterium tenebrionis]